MLIKQLLISLIIITANCLVLGFDYGQKRVFSKNTKKNSSFLLFKRERTNLNNNNRINFIKCKYFFIDKNLLNKQTNSFYKSKIESPGYFRRLYEIKSGYVSLNSNYFTTYLDDCLDGNIAESINNFITETSILYGVDLSSNSLDNSKLDLILKKNYIFKHYSNQIRYLNLSDNDLVLDNSNVIDKLIIIGNLSDPWSKLNSFISLEAFILDNNKKLNLLELTKSSSLFKKLKILSLNKCNLNEDLKPLPTMTSDLNEPKLFYFGLSGNNFGDSKLDELTNAFELILPNKIEILDLSFNKFNKIIKLFTNKSIYKLNLESNSIRLFNINEFIVKNKNLASSLELNLKHNFITNTTRELFKSYVLSSMKKIEIKLQGNPLVCDCNSLWLLDQANKFKTTQIINSNNNNNQNSFYKPSITEQSKQLLNKYPKGRKLNADINSKDDSKIKYIFKRGTEEISSHYTLNDDNYGLFMLRHKRVKLRSNQTSKSSSDQSTTKSDYPQYSTSISITDLNMLLCNFVHVFNFDEKALINSISNIDFDDGYANNFYYLKSDKNLNENKTTLNKAYKEKLIINSVYQDYMCSYEDHCKPECDCCMFFHCHCRSICPNNCKCFYDNKGVQNIVDCGNSDLSETPDSPIELVTDIRLNNNKIKIVKSHSFFGFGQLKYLYLQNNQISYISPDAFDDLKYSLKLLNLAENQLNYLSGDEFSKLKELNLIILDKNPIKSIDNSYFFDINYLPNLKLISITQTELAHDKLKELIDYSKSNTDLVIKHKAETVLTTLNFKILSTNPTIISTTLVENLKSDILGPKKEIYSLNSFGLSTIVSETQKTTSIPLDKNKTYNFLNYNKTLLNNNRDNSVHMSFIFRILKTYMFQIIVFCLFFTISLIAVLIVCLIAKYFDRNKIEKKKKQDYNCFRKNNKYSISTTSSYFEPRSNHRTMNLIKNDSIDDFDDHIEFNTGGKNNLFSKIKCVFKSSDGSFRSCHRRSSFDSADTHTDCDLSSVPASRSIKSLYLNVFIYFNVNDNYYVTNFLIPTLKKCLTIVPNTRYIIMPIKTNFVTSNPDTEFMAANFFKTNDSPFLNRSNSLNGKLLVLSENFFEYKSSDDLFKSLKQKTISSSNNNNYKGVEPSMTNYKKRNQKTNNDAEFKNAFRIYIEPNELVPNQNGNNRATLMNTNKLNTVDQKLLKRIYESTLKNSSIQAILPHNKLGTIPKITNDMFNSLAYDEQLQFKLEKYLEFICLKSSTFSKTNFSYVDYKS